MKHIVNGECLKTYFNSKKLIEKNIYSVNELFVEGPLSDEILSQRFMAQRSLYLQTEYQINPAMIQEKSEDLLAITLINHEPVTLWFDDDVYCQINLLVLLAYFYQDNKDVTVNVNIIPQQFSLITSLHDERIHAVVNPNLKQANQIYQDILVNKQVELFKTYGELELFEQLPMLKSALVWYIKLQQKNNELFDYIESHRAMSEHLLVEQLLKVYTNLGFTDMQYQNIIKKVRAN